MALIWMEGFDGGGLLTDSDMRTYLSRKYSDSTAGGNDFNDTGRFGGTSWRGRADAFIGIPVDNKATVTVGFAFKTTSVATVNNEAIMLLIEGGTSQMRLIFGSGGELTVQRGTTDLGTTSGLGLLADTWYYIELKVTISLTVGSYELRVGGTNVLSASGINTQDTSNSWIDNVVLFCDDNTVLYNFDDVYVLDNTGTFNTTFLGNMRVVLLVPDGDADQSDWTPLSGDNYTQVDDGPVVDDDTTYVETSTDEAIDIYTYPELTNIEGIAGVMFETEARETDATDYSLSNVLRTSLGDAISTPAAQASTYTITASIFESNPDTGEPWNLPDFNVIGAGFQART